MSLGLCAPSDAISLRLRLRCSDAGGAAILWAQKLPASLVIFKCDGKSLAIAILLEIFRKKKASPLRFGW